MRNGSRPRLHEGTPEGHPRARDATNRLQRSSTRAHKYLYFQQPDGTVSKYMITSNFTKFRRVYGSIIQVRLLQVQVLVLAD